MNFAVSNPDKFQTNINVHSLNTDRRITHTDQQFVFLIQEGVMYSVIKVCSTLPPHITKLLHKKKQFKQALKEYLIIYAFYSLEEIFSESHKIYN
jgi:hypothetical protein